MKMSRSFNDVNFTLGPTVWKNLENTCDGIIYSLHPTDILIGIHRNIKWNILSYFQLF